MVLNTRLLWSQRLWGYALVKKIKKCFAKGDAVEVRADVGKPWEPATYSTPAWRGWHSVQLERDRFINSMNGADCAADNPQAFKTRSIAIPTQRLRTK